MNQTANAVWVDRVTASDRITQVARRRVRTRRFIDSLVLTITLAAIAICISVYYRTKAEMETAISKHQTVSNRLTELQIRTERLANEVEHLKSDPRVIEAYARERLGYMRRGEVVVNLPQGSDPTVATSAHPQVSTLKPRKGQFN